VAGVCGGIGRYFGFDPVLVRVAAVILSVFSGFGLVLYAVGWLVIPQDSRRHSIVQRQFEPVKAGRGKARLVMFLIGVAALLGLGVAFVESAKPFWLVIALVVAVVVWRGNRRRPTARTRRQTAVPNPAPPPLSPRYEAARAAWQRRLDQARDDVAAPPTGYVLSDPVRRAADLTPPAQGFLTSNPNPFDLSGMAPPFGTAVPPSAPARPASPARPSASAPSQPSASAPPPPSASAPSQPSASAHLSAAAYAPGPARPAGPAPSPAFLEATLRPPADHTVEWPDSPAPAPNPIMLTSVLAHPAPAPEPAAATAVATRRKHPVGVGWVTLIVLAAVISGLGSQFGTAYLTDPVAIGGTVAGVFGSALALSPWTGRPRWLAPATGLFLAGSAIALFVFNFLAR
jgi:phage shock protein PspC (stress-responsive transcriptional regulator)